MLVDLKGIFLISIYMSQILNIKLLRLILLSFILFVIILCVFNPFQPEVSTVSDNITFKEKSLAFAQESFKLQREKTVRSVADGNYDNAIKIFTNYLKSKPNHPEARIFINNLKVEYPYYTIAVSMQISSNLNGSLEVLHGVPHAQFHGNNSRLVDSRMLKIAIVVDDDDDPNNSTQIAEEVATELAKTKEILGVVEHYSSDTSLPTAKSYQNYQLVSISPIITSVDLIDNTSYFFLTVPSDQAATNALAKYAQGQLNSLKLVVFYNSDSNYSKFLSQEFISELGNLNVVLSEYSDCDLATWSENLEDWGEKATNVLSKAKRNSANIVILAISSDYLDQALELVRGKKGKLTIVTGDGIYSAKTIEQSQDNALKMVVAMPWDIEGGQTNSSFLKRSQEIWRTSSVSWRAMTAYDATIALRKTISEQTKPNTEGVREKLLLDLSVSGALRKVNFLDTGDYDVDIQLVEEENIGKRKLEVKFLLDCFQNLGVALYMVNLFIFLLTSLSIFGDMVVC